MRKHFYINGVEVNEPNNHEETFIQLNYDNDGQSEAVTINQWEIGHDDSTTPNDGLKAVQDYITKGLTGGAGVTEGFPFQIYVSDGNLSRYLIFDGYLDIWQARVMQGVISCPAVEQGKLDWLNQVADSVSFEYLFETGKITRSDFYAVPYVINRKQNALELIITIVTLYMMARQLKQAIDYLLDTINDYDIIYISAIIRVIAQIVQIIVLIAAMVQLIIDLYNMIIQPVKYHYGMFVADLLEKGLEHFGLKFRSSILQKAPYNELFILPEKFNLFEENTGLFDGVVGLIKPRTQDKKGFYRGTFGQLMRLAKQLVYGKVLTEAGTLYLEKHDFVNPSPKFELPDYENNGFTYNHEDFKSNILLTFQSDINDRNTIQEYLGTSLQVIQEPKVINNRKMLLTRNFEEVNFGFALGRRKTTLNWVEKRLEVFNRLVAASTKVLLITIEKVERLIESAVKSANKFIKALKVIGISPKFNLTVPTLARGFKAQIKQIGVRVDGSRIGMLKMESDFISIPKIIMVKRNVIDRQRTLNPNSDTLLSARTMWEEFHHYRSFVEDSNGNHNQYKIYDLPDIAFTFSDYVKVRNSNRVFDSQGNTGELLDLKWNPENQTCSGKFRIKSKYTNNLTLRLIEPDGK